MAATNQRERVAALGRQPAHALGAPPTEGHEDRLELAAELGELVDRAPPGRLHEPATDDPSLLQMFEPRRQRVGADARQPVDQIAEAQRPEQQVAHHQRRPTVPDHVERRRDAAQLVVAARGRLRLQAWRLP